VKNFQLRFSRDSARFLNQSRAQSFKVCLAGSKNLLILLRQWASNLLISCCKKISHRKQFFLVNFSERAEAERFISTPFAAKKKNYL
jgi:hypothetical protein